MTKLTHELLAIRRRYLHELEKQQATFGTLTPPHITLEIAQVQAEIERLSRYSYIYTLVRDVGARERPQPAQGLIALVSPETVMDGQITLTQAAFHAIDYHRSALRHCWLIATAGASGSRKAAEWLATYCGQHSIDASVWQVQDAVHIEETQRLVAWIYDVAVQETRLQPQQIIADLTGATKSMSIGMWLACHKRYPVQYMARQEDGTSVPLLLDQGGPVLEEIP